MDAWIISSALQLNLNLVPLLGYDDCWDELTDINEREIFVYAFKLGARITIDVLTER